MTQRDRVEASLRADDGRETHRGVYARRAPQTERMGGMDYVYLVTVNREGDSGADMMPIGIYADEATAHHVAAHHRLLDDEWIQAGPWPVYREPIEHGDENAEEGGVTYQRNGWDKR